jgi:hypothetical protein
MDRQESLMNLVDALRNLYASLNESDRKEYQDHIGNICRSILEGSISADLADKMAELLNIYSTNIKERSGV